MRLILLLSLAAIACARYVEPGREKRDVEFHGWLTAEQKAELAALKSTADPAALKKRTMELYALLPSAEKTKWDGQYKELCVAWIKEIATPEEHASYAAWKAAGKVDEIKSLYAKQKARLSEEKRKDVELWEPECWSLWKDEFPTAASRDRRNVADLATEKLAFLGAAKIAELKQLKADGASDDVIRDKVVTWTLAHFKAKDNTATTAEFVKKCYSWIKDVTSTAEFEAFEKLHHTDHQACRVKVREYLTRLAADKKATVEQMLPLCDAVWYKQHTEEHGAHAGHHDNHHAHKHHVRRHLNTMHLDKHMKWLTAEQKAEIDRLEAGGETLDRLVEKMLGWLKELDEEKQEAVRAQLKASCSVWVYDNIDEAEKAALKEIVGKGDKKAIMEFLKKPYARLSEEEQHEVDNTKPLCLGVWNAGESRTRRDHHEGHHAEYKEYFSWLTPEQAAAVKALREAGNQDGVYEKVMEYFDALSGDKKAEATTKLKGACKHFFKDSFGEPAVEEIKQLKETGASMEVISAKVEEFIAKITDEKKKAIAVKATANCKKVFSVSRRRRDHHHNHEDYAQYFTWMTAEQSAAIKTLKEAGDQTAVYAKIDEFYQGLTGEKKAEATEKLKEACKHFFKASLGEAAANELKELKETGATMEAIGKRVEEFIGKITDEKKKTIAVKASASCKRIFSASRRRRDHHHDEHEVYAQYFSWLTPEQAAIIKVLKAAEDEDSINEKIEEYYRLLEGEKKTEATNKLKAACKHFFTDAFGELAVEEIRQLKETGAAGETIGAKVDEFLAKITDEKKKKQAVRAADNCKKLFAAAARARRDHGDEYKEFFTWLTPEQAAAIKALKDAGDQDGMYVKMEEFYKLLSGEKKSEATTKLKGACKHFFTGTFGAPAVEEIKQLKETGATMEAIGAKVEEFIAKITDEKKKAIAVRATKNCKAIFGESRRRRDHKHTMEEAFTEYLPWLTDAQKAELKALKESGAEDKMGEKIMHFFDTVDASKKEEARAKLQAGCKHYLKHLIGEAAANEMKELKETGATDAVMATKLGEIIAAMPEGADKKKAVGMSTNCRKVFGVASRKRRDHHEHSFEEVVTEYLSWLTPEQKTEAKNMYEAGAKDKIGAKVIEYFNALDAAKKDEARPKLQAGCRHFLMHLLGESFANEMKELKETGATAAAMATKMDEIINGLGDAEKKAKAQALSGQCKVVYGVSTSRRRRDHHEHDLESIFTEYLPWLTADQKMELKNMKEAGAKDKIGDKVIQYFEALDAAKKEEARPKVQAGCRHFLKDVLGESVAAEMKELHETGATPAAMATKLDEIIGRMEEGEKKAKAQGISKNCRKVYGVGASRKRRTTYGEFDERYQKYYTWLTEDQKYELQMYRRTDEDVLDKVANYFKDLEAAKKEEARGLLSEGCRMRLGDWLGETRADALREASERGDATREELLQKVRELIESMEEGADKKSARRSYRHCRAVLFYRRRRDLHEHDFESFIFTEGPGRARRDAGADAVVDENDYHQYVKWISEAQRKELNLMMRSTPDGIYAKMWEYLNAKPEGPEKAEATTQMAGACRLWLKIFASDQTALKLKQWRDAGTIKMGDIIKTIDGIVKSKEDEKFKQKAEAAMAGCKTFWIAREAARVASKSKKPALT